MLPQLDANAPSVESLFRFQVDNKSWIKPAIKWYPADDLAVVRIYERKKLLH